MFGWVGSILLVDLTHQKTSKLDTAAFSRQYLGGLGIGQKIYWDNALWSGDAFHPDNPLVLMTGPLAATTAPSSARLSISGKSPCIYPETFVNASMGGFFPAELKRAGYDGIVLQGKAEHPVFLLITDNRVEFKNATHLWGLGNYKTHETIRAETNQKVRIISVGPGGENRTRIGVLFSDDGGSASVGFGSLMGSKNLKAIAVQGNRTIPAADPERVKQIRKRFAAMTGEGYFNLFGTPILTPGVSVVKKSHCHGCPQGCWRSIQQNVSSGMKDIRKCQLNVFYALWDRKLHGQLTETSFRSATLANDYSLCVMELVFLLLWLDKCLESGILTEKDVELPVATMGSIEFLDGMIKKICRREGFGAVLAEGAIRASEIVGTKSREVTKNLLTQTGRAIAYGPKVFILSALIYATEPRPFITELHEVCEPLAKWALWHTSKGEKSYVSTDVLRTIGEKFWGSRDAVDFSTYEGKARASQLIQNRQYIKESLILCDFAWPVYDAVNTPDHVGDPHMERHLLSAVTGMHLETEELDQIAERIFSLNRAILLREGRKGKAEDILPEFFFVERDELVADVFGMHNPQLLLPAREDEVISRRGKAVEKEKFDQMRDEYYKLRGWDVRTGFLKKETLRSLDLHELIEPLQEKAL